MYVFAVQFNLVKFSAALCSTGVHCIAVKRRSMQGSLMQSSTVQSNVVTYSMVLSSAIQYIQYSVIEGRIIK